MKNILSGLDFNEKSRILEMHYSRSKNNYLPILSESAQSEAGRAAKAFMAIHKGNWNNMKSGQLYQYPGNEYFFTQYIVAPSQAESGALSPQQTINIIKIGRSKNDCPIPVWVGSVWMNDNGTALAPTVDQPLKVMGDDTSAGWYGFNGSMYADAYYLNTEAFSTYCTNFGATYGSQFDDYIAQNLKSFENQPGGLAGRIWLAVKPSIDRAKAGGGTPPVVKKN